jgi:hypothetical protein
MRGLNPAPADGACCRRIAGVALLVLALSFAPRGLAAAPAAPPSADEAYLDQLLGRWDIVGTVLGKPVHYHARGERALDGGFLRLHMIDAAPRPTYVADVYIGYDKKKNDFIAHWLDRFGAPGARVVASGTRAGERLVIVFPYEEGAFRDTFTWDDAGHTWRLLLESQQANGEWSVFADFRLQRPGRTGSVARTRP